MKRFYKTVTVEKGDEGFGVALDKRTLRTPSKAALEVPTEALARRVAAEWDEQEEEIAPLSMPLTQLANTAVDRVSSRRRDLVAEIAGYAETDLVCYRAAHPESLVERQSAAWDPLLNWLAEAYGAALKPTVTLLAAPQEREALDTIREAVEAHDDFALAGLQLAVGASGSVVIGLALSHSAIDAAQAAEAALLDDLYQIEEWGKDEEALRRIEALRRDIEAAAAFLELLRKP